MWPTPPKLTSSICQQLFCDSVPLNIHLLTVADPASPNRWTSTSHLLNSWISLLFLRTMCSTIWSVIKINTSQTNYIKQSTSFYSSKASSMLQFTSLPPSPGCLSVYCTFGTITSGGVKKKKRKEKGKKKGIPAHLLPLPGKAIACWCCCPMVAQELSTVSTEPWRWRGSWAEAT